MANEKLLIVDDELDVLQLLEARLTAEGYVINKATRGDEAIQKVQEVSPDLILMDIMLPDIDGPEIVRTLQEDPLIDKIPVLFLSGIVSKEGKEEESDKTVTSVTVGGINYKAIPKPFVYEDLLREVKRILSEQTS